MTTAKPRVAAAVPLLVLPLLATTVVGHLDVPDFVRGLVMGISIALMLGCCVYLGSFIGVSQRAADDRRLTDLDPLSDLARREDKSK